MNPIPDIEEPDKMGKLNENGVSPFILHCTNFGTCPNEYAKMGRTKEEKMQSGATLRKIIASDSAVAMVPRTPFANVIIPLFEYLQLLGWSHFKFEFDPATQSFLYLPGGILKKIWSYFLFFVTTVGLYTQSEATILMAGKSQLTALMRITQISYITLTVAFFYVLHARGQYFLPVLNFMQHLTVVMQQIGCEIPKKAKCAKMSKLLIILLSMYGLANSLEPFILAYLNDRSTSFFGFYSQQLINQIFLTTGLAGDNNTETFSTEVWNDLPYWVVASAAAFKFFQSLEGTAVWIYAVMLLIFWGTVFQLIYQIFIAIVSKNSSRNTLEDMRTFNMITDMLDKFNYAMGPLTLMLCVTCIAHFSVNVVALLDSSAPWLHRIITGVGILYFGAMLIVSSHVNREASRFLEVIKTRFQDFRIWKEYHGHCQETTQGLILLLSEIQSNNIGFKGLGFFTITYSFIGTVMSLISTYAIVVLQFQKS